MRFADLTIKLDHFGSLPLAEIDSISRRITKNPFCQQLLVNLVINHIVNRGLNRDARRDVKRVLQIEVGGSESQGITIV